LRILRARARAWIRVARSLVPDAALRSRAAFIVRAPAWEAANEDGNYPSHPICVSGATNATGCNQHADRQDR
jgi:hypothetical protein